MPRVGPTDGAKGFGRAVHEVRAVAAMDVQFDEAGNEVAAGEVDGFSAMAAGGAHRGDPLTLNANGGALQDAIGQDNAAALKNDVAHRRAPSSARKLLGAGRANVSPAFAAQGPQKRDEVLLVLVGEL